jgi:type IV pilus assembly protein PilC
MAANTSSSSGQRGGSIADREFHVVKRVTKREVAAFFRELSILIDVGIPVLRALQIMETRTHNPNLRDVVRDLTKTIEEGGTLHAGMEKHSRVFTDLEVGVVRVGEKVGALEQCLRRLSDFLESDLRFRGRLLYALMYPAFALIAAAAALVVILVFVIPQFTVVFAGAENELPWPTRFMISLSNALQGWSGIVVLLVVIAIVVLGYLLSKSGGGRRITDGIKLRFRLPWAGPVGTKAAVARSCGTFAILLRSGAQVLESLRIVGRTAGNVHIETAFDRAADRVEQGQKLAAALEETGRFPPLAIDMINTGDEAGALDVVLEKVAETYQEDVDLALESMNRIIEPILILVMGLCVLFIAASVYLPYFQLGRVIEAI